MLTLGEQRCGIYSRLRPFLSSEFERVKEWEEHRTFC